MPPAGDAKKIELGEMPDNTKVNKPVTLAIIMNGAKGNLDAKVHTPSGTEDDCFLAPLDASNFNYFHFLSAFNIIDVLNIQYVFLKKFKVLI